MGVRDHGVRDLVKLVKRIAPSCITPYPSLHSFAGSRFALDANLLTTKFHFSGHGSGSPRFQRHRIVQQWYFLLQALESRKIQPIVVFDRETKVQEKERENERRRNARELERLRGGAEDTRGERYEKLKEVWGRVRKGDRRAVAKGMREALERRQAGAAEATVEAAHPHQAVQTILGLYDDFRSDEANPIYSKNQVLIPGDEGAFLQMILALEGGHQSTTIDLEDVIARSDKLGASRPVRAVHVRPETHLAVRELVTALGVPFVVPSLSEPHEAEGFCSMLCSLGLADYVVSDDTDVTLYGAPLLRQFSTLEEHERSVSHKDKRTREPINVLDAIKLREALGLTKEEFVDFALLCGTDFSERMPSLDPLEALSLIREHSTIEAILAHHPDKYRPPGKDLFAYLQMIRDARAIYLSLPTLPASPPACPSSSAANDLTNSPSPTPSPQSSGDTSVAFLSPRPPSPNLARILKNTGIVMRTRVDETDTAGPIRYSRRRLRI
ncbi:hypothetical protein JCM5296_003788 [Sporobolomyces johnsonii]